MDSVARQALVTIRRCIRTDHVRLTIHFRTRLAERAVLWADLHTLFDAPFSAEPDAWDDEGRSRWIVRGEAADGSELGVVCAIGRDADGEITVFVTAFWEDRP
jgi:hypothetical protein